VSESSATDVARRRPGPDAPLAIEARGLSKAFRIPTHRVDSFKERLVRPFASRDYRVLQALDDVSFEIRQGEFFGIVGRNGSGKSTLLKLLASIYRADAGTIRMAGRLAPFIELGVGFNLELTARENVLLNGVMMGLTPQQTRDRFDAVIEFAELEEFAELKLKNYSSGMLVRLAFSTMLEADADVLLIDEVLAVGDAAFQQKCADAFHELKARGKTIVLVTHAMPSVEEYCDRAMLVEDGNIVHIGDPAEIGREYLKLNFEQDLGTGAALLSSEEEVRLVDAWLEDGGGEHVTALEEGDEIHLRATLEVLEAVPGLIVGFIIANADGITVFEFGQVVERPGGVDRFEAGERVSVKARIENRFTPGRYLVHCGVNKTEGAHGAALYVHNAAGFVVFGSDQSRGVVLPEHELDFSIEGRGAVR
jgi:ABC-type polysaccharide/polyol phosphate transport system ATPase subunit